MAHSILFYTHFRLVNFVLVFVIFTSSTLTHAYDVAPEYQGFHEREMERIEKPSDLNSEYQLIWNGFLPPIESRHFAADQNHLDHFENTTQVDNGAHVSHDNSLWISVGSLSNNYFFIYGRAQISTELTESLKFYFTHFQQRDSETDQIGQVIELRQRVGRDFQLALYGEPSHYKRQNDIGAAVIYTLAKNTHRLYHTWHDFTRNSHNNEGDRFTKEGKPTSIGWISDIDWGATHTQLGFRYDRPTEWVRPQDDLIMRYKKTTLFLNLIAPVTLEMQIDRTFKEQAPDDSASLVKHESSSLEREWLRASYERLMANWGLTYKASLSAISRRWHNEKSENVKTLEVLPGMTIKKQTFRRGDNFDSAIVGLEASFYDKDDQQNVTGNTQQDEPIEGRIQTAYEFGFKNNNRLILALNFDADDFRPYPTFEGGNGQLFIEF